MPVLTVIERNEDAELGTRKQETFPDRVSASKMISQSRSRRVRRGVGAVGSSAIRQGRIILELRRETKPRVGARSL